jgi:hypothetical protein
MKIPDHRACPFEWPSAHGLKVHGEVLVEMGESRTPRPEPFAGDHYERVR